MISRFEVGKWYRWARKEAGPGWSEAHGMKRMLDGKPHQCSKVSHGDQWSAFDDIPVEEGIQDETWIWGDLSGFEEVAVVADRIQGCTHDSQVPQSVDFFSRYFGGFGPMPMDIDIEIQRGTGRIATLFGKPTTKARRRATLNQLKEQLRAEL